MSRVRKGVRAEQVQVGDMLAEGTIVRRIERERPASGHRRMTLDDGRVFIAPNHYLVEVRRAIRSKESRAESQDASPQ